MASDWDDRTPELITRARLLNLPAIAVYDELKRYGLYVVESCGGSMDDVEQDLLAKGDPLVNLGLAQYGGSRKVGVELYKRSFATSGDVKYNRALRLALLRNQGHANALAAGTFGILEDGELSRLALTGEWDEVWSMLLNSGAKTLIAHLYNRKPPFDQVPMERFLAMVGISSQNPCINDDNSNRHGPDMAAWDVQNGVWSLVKNLPVTEKAVEALYWLLNALDPRRTALAGDDPTPVYRRWQQVQIGEKANEYHRDVAYTDLGYKQEFGVLLAAHYHAYSADKKVACVGSLDAADLILRCAHYGDARLTVDQMRQAHDRDGDAFTLAAMFNETLFWDQSARALLEEYMRGRLIQLYQRRCEQINRDKPGFDLKPISEQGALLLEDEERPPSEDEKRWARLEEHLTVAAGQLKSLATLGQWTILLLVIALVVLWWRR